MLRANLLNNSVKSVYFSSWYQSPHWLLCGPEKNKILAGIRISINQPQSGCWPWDHQVIQTVQMIIPSINDPISELHCHVLFWQLENYLQPPSTVFGPPSTAVRQLSDQWNHHWKHLVLHGLSLKFHAQTTMHVLAHMTIVPYFSTPCCYFPPLIEARQSYLLFLHEGDSDPIWLFYLPSFKISVGSLLETQIFE